MVLRTRYGPDWRQDKVRCCNSQCKCMHMSNQAAGVHLAMGGLQQVATLAPIACNTHTRTRPRLP